jgi:hypothetical protein
MFNAPIIDDYNGGLVLDFFDSSEYELQDDTNTDALARDYVRMHMLPWKEHEASCVSVSRRIQKALIYQYDAEFIQAIRKVYYDGLVRVYHQLKAREAAGTLTPEQNNQAHLYISNCLTALPFTDPSPYECFKFPQLVEGTWTLVDYTVHLIELTEESRALKDKVFAYGFSPLVERRCPAHFVFAATTYPAGRGFVTQMGANMDAFTIPGRSLYESGHMRVGAWCDKQNAINHVKTHAHGNSQGGALTLQLAIHQGDKLAKAYALNPPGLFEVAPVNDAFDRWHEEGFNRPLVIVQENAGDWVHTYGKRKHDWLRFYVEPPVISGIAGVDHASNFAARPGVKIINKCSREANEERDTRDVWVHVRFRALCRYVFYWPYVNVIRPIQLPFVVMLSTLMLCSVLPAILAVPALAVVGVMCLVLATLDLYAYWTQEIVTGDPHRLDAPRVSSMDMYNTTQDAWFSLESLSEYYRVKREVLKDKQSHVSTNSHVRFFKEDGCAYPKYNLLTDSQWALSDGARVRVQATPAKLADIRDTLACLDDTHALQEQDMHYRLGKSFK